jgi:hypothetical protein
MENTLGSLAKNMSAAVSGFLLVVIGHPVVEPFEHFYFYGRAYMTLLILWVSGVNPVEKQSKTVIRWNNV